MAHHNFIIIMSIHTTSHNDHVSTPTPSLTLGEPPLFTKPNSRIWRNDGVCLKAPNYEDMTWTMLQENNAFLMEYQILQSVQHENIIPCSPDIIVVYQDTPAIAIDGFPETPTKCQKRFTSTDKRNQVADIMTAVSAFVEVHPECHLFLEMPFIEPNPLFEPQNAIWVHPRLFKSEFYNPKVSLKDIYHVFRQLTSGLAHIQLTGYLHQDVKMENVIVDANNHVYIIDFGGAEYLNRKVTYNSTTITHVPPEMLMFQRERINSVDELKQYIHLSNTYDTWSLGMTLFTYLTNTYFTIRDGSFAAQLDDVIGWIKLNLSTKKKITTILERVLSQYAQEDEVYKKYFFSLLPEMLVINPRNRKSLIQVHEANKEFDLTLS